MGDVYLWHLHSVCERCASIDGCWRLSIDGGLSMSIDGRTNLSIDVDINRAGRMRVFFCELLVSHNPHGIARCSRLRSPASIHTNAIRRNSSSFILQNLFLAASPASPVARNHHL
ncbi:hypothetical protein DY000_02007917 [Brassica cretica]|uniref:Uncharacterized protein n=1 Tax=Brassica cretica TaxID=69181 RepID=A0ABQ7C4C9_BRACR|nr:hypothetical protein DY000_02007917 [Brassica cretica]